MDPVATVTEMLDRLAAGRAEAALELIAPDIEWRNTGFPTIRGERVAWTLRELGRRSIRFHADMHHIAADGDAVLTDRTDYLGYGRYEASFWVRGTFVVRDGQVVLWDDAFATGNVIVGSLKGLGALFRR
jgi:limonene-1,2-epoxide hydrolase